MSEVFISYSTKDKQYAQSILASLEGNGIACWIAPRDIPPGEDYAGEITKAIRGSSVFLVLVSDHSMDSDQVKNEINLATEYRKNIIPCRLQDLPLSDSFKYHLGTKQWVDIYEPNAMDTLIGNVRRYLTPKGRNVQEKTAPRKQAPPKTSASKPATGDKPQPDIDGAGMIGMVLGVVLVLGGMVAGAIYLINSGILGSLLKWVVIILGAIAALFLGFFLIIFLIHYSDSKNVGKALVETCRDLKESWQEQK